MITYQLTHTTTTTTTSHTPHNPSKHIKMRGNATQIRVHFKGDSDDFIVFAESVQAVEDWKKDRSIPLAQVVDSFKVFVTHK